MIRFGPKAETPETKPAKTAEKQAPTPAAAAEKPAKKPAAKRGKAKDSGEKLL